MLPQCIRKDGHKKPITCQSIHSSRTNRVLIGYSSLLTTLSSALTWSFTDTAVDGVDTGCRFQACGRWFGQVTTKASVAGLPGLPLESGVGKR